MTTAKKRRGVSPAPSPKLTDLTAAELAAAQERLEPSTKRRPVYSRDEVRQHLLFVESLILQPGLTETQRAEACRKRFGFSRNRYINLQTRIREVWAREDAHLIAQRKNEQSRRVFRHLQGAMGQKDPQTGQWTTKPNWPAVARFEELIADLHGTREPLRIDIDARASEAVMLVIAQLTPEQVQERLDRHARRVELAEQAERLQLAQGEPPTRANGSSH